MKIDKKTVTYLASLAKIKLTNKETEKFSKQLNEIVTFVKKLNEVKDSTQIKKEYLSLDNISRIDNSIFWPEDEKEIALNKNNKDSDLIKAPEIKI